MPAISKIGYYDSRGAYMTKYRGKQYLLAKGPEDAPDGPVYREAAHAFAKLMGAAHADQAGDDNRADVVLVRYYEHMKDTRSEEDYARVRGLLDSAIEDFGDVAMKTLKPLHVLDWLQKRRQYKPEGRGGRIGPWGESTCVLAFTHLKTAMNWALSSGLIPRNPLASAKIPYRQKSRGEDYAIPRELRALLVFNANEQWDLILRILDATGARPGEILHAEAFNYKDGKIIHRWNTERGYVWKAAKKSRRDRVIYIPPSLREEFATLCRKYPSGPLFRTSRDGKPYTKQNAAAYFKCLRERPAVDAWMKSHGVEPKQVVLYGFRHAFITDALKLGRSIHHIATLCGTSVKMIEQHYSHLAADTVSMAQLATLFDAERQSLP